MSSEPHDQREAAAVDLAVDFWKLLRVAERILAGLPEERQKRICAAIRFSSGRLDGHLFALGLNMPTFEGKQFGPQLPAVAVNAEDFDIVDALIVESAVEPAVIRDGKVVQNARVVLKKGDTDVSGD